MDKFTLIQKLDAVRRYQNGSESVRKIAKSIHAPKSVVLNWIKQYVYDGLSCPSIKGHRAKHVS